MTIVSSKNKLMFNVGDGRKSEAEVELILDENGAASLMGTKTNVADGEDGSFNTTKIWMGDTGRVSSGEQSGDDRKQFSVDNGGSFKTQSSELKAMFRKVDADSIYDIIKIELGLISTSDANIIQAESGELVWKRGSMVTKISDGIDGVELEINGDASVTIKFDGRAKNGETDDLTVTGDAVEALIDIYAAALIAEAEASGASFDLPMDPFGGGQGKVAETVMVTQEVLETTFAKTNVIKDKDKITTSNVGPDGIDPKDVKGDGTFKQVNKEDMTGSAFLKGINDQDVLTTGNRDGDVFSMNDYDQITHIDDGNGNDVFLFDFGGSNKVDTLIVTSGVAGIEESSVESISGKNKKEEVLSIVKGEIDLYAGYDKGETLVTGTDNWTFEGGNDDDAGQHIQGSLKSGRFEQHVLNEETRLDDVEFVETVVTAFGDVDVFTIENQQHSKAEKGPVEDDVILYAENELALSLVELDASTFA